jgi:hypothetical protein
MLSAFDLSDLRAAALIGWLALVYVAYIASGALPSDARPCRRPATRVLLDRLAFFVLIGLLPPLAFLLLGWPLPGLSVLGFGKILEWLPLTAALTALCWAIGRYSRKGEAELANYPQYLPSRWKAGSLALEIGSWALYLAAYEFAFRGYILYALLPGGTLVAIAIQTALYSFAHLPKSAKEAAGALLFGVATSLLTLAYGSILPAFILHLAMALGNDLGSLRAAAKGRAAKGMAA